MADSYSCDLNALLGATACFQDKCMAQSDRDAVKIYARIKNLAALGGTDYSSDLTQLMDDAALWRLRSPDELAAVDVYITLQNAINNGASIDTAVSALATAIKCLKGQCVGTADAQGLLAYLKCAIETQEVAA